LHDTALENIVKAYNAHLKSELYSRNYERHAGIYDEVFLFVSACSDNFKYCI